jgi:hypothetical protein
MERNYTDGEIDEQIEWATEIIEDPLDILEVREQKRLIAIIRQLKAERDETRIKLKIMRSDYLAENKAHLAALARIAELEAK